MEKEENITKQEFEKFLSELIGLAIARDKALIDIIIRHRVKDFTVKINVGVGHE